MNFVVLDWNSIFFDEFISKMNGVFQILNLGFRISQEAPIQDK